MFLAKIILFVALFMSFLVLSVRERKRNGQKMYVKDKRRMRTFTRCWLTTQMIMINERFYSNSMKLDFNGNINPILSRMSCTPSPLPSWKFFRYTHRPPTLDAPLCKRNVSNIHTYLLQSQPLRDIPLQDPSAVIS